MLAPRAPGGCPVMSKRRVVVVGGGLAAVSVAQTIAKLLRTNEKQTTDITLISRDDHLTLSSVLPELITGRAQPSHCSVNLRTALGDAINFVRADVRSIQPDDKTLMLEGASVRSGATPALFAYDQVVFALGLSTSFGAVVGAEERALRLETMPDAFRIRARLLESLAHADAEESPRRRRSLLSVVVLGAGARGCQIAGEILAFYRQVLPRFHRVCPEDLQVMIVDREVCCMPNRDARISENTRDQLIKLGVTLRLNATLVSVADDHVIVRDPGAGDERIETRTVIWTSQTTAPTIFTPLFTNEEGYLQVDNTFKAVDRDAIWAVGKSITGDFINMPLTENTVLKHCNHVANNVVSALRNSAPRAISRSTDWSPYSLGPGHAILHGFGTVISGPMATMAWRISSLMRVPTLRLRLRTALDQMLDTIISTESGLLRLGESGPSLFLTPYAPPVQPVRETVSRDTQEGAPKTASVFIPPVIPVITTAPVPTSPMTVPAAAAPPPPPPPPPSKRGHTAPMKDAGPVIPAPVVTAVAVIPAPSVIEHQPDPIIQNPMDNTIADPIPVATEPRKETARDAIARLRMS